MAIVHDLTRRRLGLGLSRRPNVDFALSTLRLTRQVLLEEYPGSFSPHLNAPLAMAFRDNLLAVVGERQNVMLINVDKFGVSKTWIAHSHCIYDVKWRPNYLDQLLTASGDHSIALWDINQTQENADGRARYSEAHSSSLKSISFSDSNVFASGARDGYIKIWDIRCPQSHETAVIPKAHISRASSTSKCICALQSNMRLNSVTGVLFHPNTPHLFSCGTCDETIKLWDIRQLKSRGNVSPTPTPAKTLTFLMANNSSFHGYTSLTFDSSFRIYASCSNHHIYSWELSNTENPVQYVGHRVDNYSLIKVLDDHLISGSTNGSAYVWPINRRDRDIVWPSYVLPHIDEVCAIECDPIHWNIFTASGEKCVSKWSMFPGVMREGDKKQFQGLPECKAIPYSGGEDKTKASPARI
jgi:WD40 repeat protein